MSQENEEVAQIGYCDFCHQGMTIQTVGEVTQERLNIIATNKCQCPEAKSERRKIERREKVNNYVEKNFSDQAVQTIKGLVELVEHGEFEQVVITHAFDGWKTTMKTDKDGYLVITKKRTVVGDSLRE